MNIDRNSIASSPLDSAGQSQGPDPMPDAEHSQSNAAKEPIALSASVSAEAERICDMVEEMTSQRLTQVRSAIAGGTYAVSGKAVARALIKSQDL